MSNSIDNLKFFLKEMFQFNENDLDFGIYKIYNLKRRYIESFIDGDGEQDLIPTIEQILQEVNLENQKTDSIELYNFLKGKNMESLLEEPEANFEDIQLALNFEKDVTKKTNLVETLNKLTKSEGITDDLKDKIYNHILGFFQMYYSNGDFGYNDRSRDLYKVPYEADYNGSDTMFHWKHKGSLYIKSATSFNAIKFELKGKKIEYRLETNIESENEGTSRNNNKDDQLKHYRFDRIEEIDGVHQVIFNFSNASTSKVDIYKAIYETVFGETDIDKYLTYEKDGNEKNVFVDLTKDFDTVQNGQIKGLSALRQKKNKVATSAKKNFDRGTKLYDEESKQFLDETLADLYTLDQKLNSFYIGHDADYFIHENLHEFLTNEKQRYVKNYIFDDLESIYSGKLDNTTILIAKAFDKVSSRIIEFLSAIEDFQKHLFTKKKKVVESEYCITLDYIKEDYYAEIVENKAQLEEWQKLFSVEVKSIEDLKENPTMVLDTKLFRQEDGSNPFKDKILAEIEDLEENCNGLLMNTENYQGLELLQTKFKEKIKTIYIDPPYNTDSSSIIYKNNFKHSSWASLMKNRISKSYSLQNEKSFLKIAIDDEELFKLNEIVEEMYSRDNFIANITIVHKPEGRNQENFFGTSNEYMLVYAKNKNKTNFYKVLLDKKTEDSFDKEDEFGKYKSKNFIRLTDGKYALREAKPDFYYPIYVSLEQSRIDITPFENSNLVYPITESGVERTWKTKPNTFLDYYKKGNIEAIKENGNIVIYEKLREDQVIRTHWVKKEYHAYHYGTKLLENILGSKAFSFPKSIITVKDVLKLSTKFNDITLDYFAGSGTTGHAVIKLNKEDNSNRKYFMIEMGEYFDFVTKPRIQKVIYSDNWKGGTPQDKDGSPKHIFKYQVLEQYEDVLDNLQVYEGDLPEGLPIKYLYKPEQNSLDHNLDIYHPFSNRIKYGRAGTEGFVDLIETYNYLVGYFIKTIKPYNIGDKYYKVVETQNGALVIWRDIALNEDDSAAIIEIAEQYQDIHTIEVNAEFATLQLDKNNNLKIGGKEIELKIIHKEIFNQ